MISNKIDKINLSYVFNPLSIAIISAICIAFHWRYTADKAADMVGALIAYLMSPGLLYMLLLCFSIYAAKYLRIKYVGLNAALITIGLFIAYIPGIMILMHVFFVPI